MNKNNLTLLTLLLSLTFPLMSNDRKKQAAQIEIMNEELRRARTKFKIPKKFQKITRICEVIGMNSPFLLKENLKGKKIDLNQYDFYGNFPLMAAVMVNNLDLLKILFDYGVDPNMTLRNGVSPWMMAAAQGQKEVMKLLLEHKVDMKQELDGLNAMDIAEAQGNIASISFLAVRGLKGNNTIREKLEAEQALEKKKKK